MQTWSITVHPLFVWYCIIIILLQIHLIKLISPHTSMFSAAASSRHDIVVHVITRSVTIAALGVLTQLTRRGAPCRPQPHKVITASPYDTLASKSNVFNATRRTVARARRPRPHKVIMHRRLTLRLVKAMSDTCQPITTCLIRSSKHLISITMTSLTPH